MQDVRGDGAGRGTDVPQRNNPTSYCYGGIAHTFLYYTVINKLTAIIFSI